MVASTLLAAVAIIALLVLRVTIDRLHGRATGRPSGDCQGCAGCARLVPYDHDHHDDHHRQGSEDAPR
ncbi:MAG: hypothetical protein KDK70_13215 [Myxococcales bacterium]|nr:hypothetical protein [Myxococcales bacterium]